MAYAITSLFSRPIIGRFLDHHGGDVVMYPTLIILALCMLPSVLRPSMYSLR